MKIRPKWDEYFMNICKAVSLRSHDTDTQVGCVIVDKRHRVISTGYNGFPQGCDDSVLPENRKDVWKYKATDCSDEFYFKNGLLEYSGFANLNDDEEFEVEYNKYDVITHAEANAIISARQSLAGCRLYVSGLFPCNECAKLIITAGIDYIIYENERDDKLTRIAKMLFGQAGVWYDKYEGGDKDV